ncbi:hypothetical protein J4402_03695 [Candidatus Pacearchaeota archaeon]|nr:hypothetical protein [Candidatus Pacearchaeota archaeon]
MVLEQSKRGNWACCLSQLGGRGVASTADVIKDAISDYKGHCLGSIWTSENFNVVGGRILSARKEFNPLIKYARQAVESQMSREFYLTPEIVDANGKPYAQLLEEIAEEDAGKPFGEKRVADFGETITHSVPTDSFADDDAIVFLTGGERLANKFGLFLRNKLPEELRLPSVMVYFMQLSDRDYSRGTSLCSLGKYSKSDINCGSNVYLQDDGVIFMA